MLPTKEYFTLDFKVQKSWQTTNKQAQLSLFLLGLLAKIIT